MSPDLSGFAGIFITGANGWLGRRVVLAAKAANLPITALVMPHEDAGWLRAQNVQVVAGDVGDADARAEFLKRAEGGLLVHLAGVIHPFLRSAEFERVNHHGAIALLRDAMRVKLKRVVIMSSNSPLGANKSPTDVFTEESPYNPYMGYGRSKMRMEEDALQLALGRANPDLVIIRAPWFYGPGQPARQTQFFRMVRDGKFPLMGPAENRRSMAYVDELAQGILLAASTPRAGGQIYWLADERAYPMHEVVSTVKTMLRDDFGMKVADKDWMVPPVLSDIARGIDFGLQAVGLYHQKVHVLSEMNLTIACSIEKAKRELGFNPQVGLREGMRRAVQWCMQNGQKI